MTVLTPQLLLKAYAAGIFPMSDSAGSDDLYWFCPELRGVLPLDKVHVPRKLRRTVRQGVFQVRIDTAFAQVIACCAEATQKRPQTWINAEITQLCLDLHAMGFAHSVECWRGDRLAGGLYGVALGGAFFGESMFSRETDASKVALIHLLARLRRGGFVLLDTQYVTRHLTQFGTTEIPRHIYERHLADAITREADFHGVDQDAAVRAFLEETTVMNGRSGPD